MPRLADRVDTRNVVLLGEDVVRDWQGAELEVIHALRHGRPVPGQKVPRRHRLKTARKTLPDAFEV